MTEIINADALQFVDTLPDKSINLVVTSPPYNVDLGNNKYNTNPYDLYNDNKEHVEYIQWLKQLFGKIKQLLTEDGRVCINIGDGRNGSVPTSSDIIQFMTKELNYIMLAHIIWNKSQIGNRTAWGSFKSPSCPSYPTPFEHILIFANENKKLTHKGEIDLTKEEFITYANALWTFTPETRAKKIGHPAPFPVELPYRLIKMNSYVGDTVFDPFCGSGTTGVACAELNRNFIGTDISEEYCKIAKERINSVPIKNIGD